MHRYQLAPRVFVAATEDGAVLLDLERDDYLGLDADQSRAMADVVEGWMGVDQRGLEARRGQAADAPFERGETGTCAECGERAEVSQPSAAALVSALIQELCERGILIEHAVDDARDGRSCGCPRTRELPAAFSELVLWEQTRHSRVRFSQLAAFVWCLLKTLLLMRVLRFARIVSRVQERKNRAAAMESRLSCAALKEAAGAYFHIRPFFFGAKSRCLLDSLTLIEFLAHYRLYPDWVIGVQINPFGSHSWVQQGAFVINGTPSVVRAYSAILVV